VGMDDDGDYTKASNKLDLLYVKKGMDWAYV
jgi:hypothetical protein